MKLIHKGQLQRTAKLSGNNLKISLAVRAKFFLLLLTLGWILNTVSRKVSYKH